MEAKDRFMLRSVEKLFEDKLGASDGEIGHVNDFYFDDQNWAVRYLVADTGSWMPGRLVLISPHALGTLYQGGSMIENKPNLQMRKLTAENYEYHAHGSAQNVRDRKRHFPKAPVGTECADEPAFSGRR